METNTLSRRVRSPEDIQIGDFIAVTHTRYELLPGPFDPAPVGRESVEPLRVTMIPPNAGEPLKVVAISLPFVMAESHDDRRFAIDTRQHVLTRVSTEYAMSAKKPKARKGKGGARDTEDPKGKKNR